MPSDQDGQLFGRDSRFCSLFWHVAPFPQGLCWNHCFPLAAAGFIARVANAVREYSLSQWNLLPGVMLEIIEFRWFYKGLQLTVRFQSWRQAPDLLCGGFAEGTFKNPKEF